MLVSVSTICTYVHILSSCISLVYEWLAVLFLLWMPNTNIRSAPKILSIIGNWVLPCDKGSASAAERTSPITTLHLKTILEVGHSLRPRLWLWLYLLKLLSPNHHILGFGPVDCLVRIQNHRKNLRKPSPLMFRCIKSLGQTYLELSSISYLGIWHLAILKAMGSILHGENFPPGRITPRK